MDVLFVEPLTAGHRMASHARLLVREAHARGWTVELMTTPSSATHAATQAVVAEAKGALRIQLMPELPATSPHSFVGRARAQVAKWKAMTRGYQLRDGRAPDAAYIVDMDAVARALALRGSPFGPTPLSGMLMALGYHRRAMQLGPTTVSDRLQRFTVQRLARLSALRGVALIDERLAEFHAQQRGAANAKFTLVPDVGEVPACVPGADRKHEARAALGIRADAFVLLLYGSLTLRKGVRQLLDAIDRHPDPRVVALLAGREDVEVRALLDSAFGRRLTAIGRLIHSSGFHDSARERQVFNAADSAWVGYVDFFGSSGVLYQAGSAKLPVIASKAGLVGWTTDRYGVGITCNPSNPAAVLDAIDRLRQPALANALGHRGWQLSREHTEAKFAASICDLIARTVA